MPSSAPGPTATIMQKSERAPDWLNIFGRLSDIPVTKYLPDVVNLPGKPASRVYFLDLLRITPSERSKLIGSIARRFNLDRNFVEQHLDAEGCPILADEVVVAIPLRFLI